MEKLTIAHLAPYLPFQAKVQVIREDTSVDYITLTASQAMLIEEDYHFEPKLCLRPLLNLTKEIEHNGEKVIPLAELLKENCFDIDKMDDAEFKAYERQFLDIDFMFYRDVQVLLRYHFDVFGLIGSGLAVDVNSLNKLVGL